MALDIQNIGRASVSANEPITTLTSGDVVGCFREYNYYTDDTQATVSASGYFNDSTAYAGMGNQVVTGDYINVYSSTDGTRLLYRMTNTSGVITTSLVSGVSQGVTTITLAEFIGSGNDPFAVIPAPGAGMAVINPRINLVLDYGGTVFANGGNFGFQYGTTDDLGGLVCTGEFTAAELINATADSAFVFAPLTLTSDNTLASVTNEAIRISTATDFTGGDDSVFKAYYVADVVPSVV